MKYSTIKEAIKDLSQQQKELKPQRKTVHFKGTRTVEPGDATYKVDSNRYRLRHMFIAYAILKGKEPIYPKKAEWSQSVVDNLVKNYTVKDVA